MEGKLADASIFKRDTCAKEINSYRKVKVNLASYIRLTDDLYQRLTADERIRKVLTIEAFRYYAVSILWIRIINLKKEAGDQLTQQEQDVAMMSEMMDLNVPDPLRIYLTSLGHIQTLNGENYHVAFPSLPSHVLTGQDQGGYFSHDLQTPVGMNLYTEIPTLGVAAEALKHLVDTNAEPGHWTPAPATNDLGLLANRNLLGYSPKGIVKKEAISKLMAIGIEPDQFPTSVEGTAFSYVVIDDISNILAQVTTFKMTSVPVATYSPLGSPAIMIVSKPEAPEKDFYSGEFHEESLNKEDTSTFTRAATMLFQAWKEPKEMVENPTSQHAAIEAPSAEEVDPEEEQLPSSDQVLVRKIFYDHSTWTALEYTRQHPCPSNIANARNDRRETGKNTLPARFRTDLPFVTLSWQARALRRDFLDSLQQATKPIGT